MDYSGILKSCKEPAVGEAVLGGLNRLFERDVQLLTCNASEQAIAAKLAQYLQPHFPGYHVDVEYNRMGKVPKKVTWSERPDEVYPDIIVHLRMTDKNVLAIELKKNSNSEKKEKDILKLGAYRRELGYLHALFIRLGVGAGAGTVSECEWVHLDKEPIVR
jgi:hypothetical protein